MSRWGGVLCLGGLVMLFGLALVTGAIEMAGAWADDIVLAFCASWRASFGNESILGENFMVMGLLAATLATLICGIFSSLIVSNRMAFFSDALAHCGFAGVSLGLVLYLLGVLDDDAGILGVTVVFGILVGLAIAYVREQTSLANDTVIGVFFAGAMGLGVVLLKAVSGRGVRGFSPENFLFGDILTVGGRDLVFLACLLAMVFVFLAWYYNRLVFASFSPSLARSRNFQVRLGNYLFIVVLALIVSTCIKVVGILLINALLVIPGATAAVLARNLRQFFWWSVVLSLAAGVGGLVLSYGWEPHVGGITISLVSGGTIVVLGVLMFFAAMFLGPLIRGKRGTLRTGF